MSTSKQLGSLIKKAPPATAREEDELVPSPAAPPLQSAAMLDPDVPTQIKIPQSVRRQLDHLSIDTGEDLRVLMLRALRSLGITVADEHLKSRRGRRS